MNISISEIEKELPKYGIDYIKLNSYNIMLENFKKDYNAGKIPTYFTRFKGGKQYEYSNYKMRQKMSYEEVKSVGSGSWNETFIHKDSNGNEYIIKKSRIIHDENNRRLTHNEKIEKLFDALYENLKHIILYIIITKYVGNIKLFPKPYYCGFLKSPTINDIDQLDHIIVMEKGYKTVDKYIRSLNRTNNIMYNPEDSYEEQQNKLKEVMNYELKKIVVNIYHYLILINRLTLINFKK